MRTQGVASDDRALRRTRYLIASAVAFALYLSLGTLVAHRPPSAFDTFARSESGRLTTLALFFTRSGLFPAYASLCALAFVLAAFRRELRLAAGVVVVELLVTWRLSDFWKDAFRRPRPLWWHRIHESSWSYASGHAALSLAFYGFVAYVVWYGRYPLAVKRIVAVACGAWTLAVAWSRLALGAHFPTDLIGGWLLGSATLGVAIVAYERLQRRAGSAGAVRADGPGEAGQAV
jgi:undecaprenyl-diphosphatase